MSERTVTDRAREVFEELSTPDLAHLLQLNESPVGLRALEGAEFGRVQDIASEGKAWAHFPRNVANTLESVYRERPDASDVSIEQMAANRHFIRLCDFDKPRNCDVCIEVPSEIHPWKEVRLGWRPGDPSIYEEDGACAGSYRLPKPLEEMNLEELRASFPENERFLVGWDAFAKLWKLALEQVKGRNGWE